MSHLLSLRHYRDEVIAHSHEHAQVVINLSGSLDVEVEGRASLLRQQQLMVIPAGAHHTCASAQGSQCLVLDVPSEHWLGQTLGAHAEHSRRWLNTVGQHRLDPRQHQLVDWLAASPATDPLIDQQGAILLLASLNTPQAVPRKRLPFPQFDTYIDRTPPTLCKSPTWRALPTCPALACTVAFSASAAKRRWTTSANAVCVAP